MEQDVLIAYFDDVILLYEKERKKLLQKNAGLLLEVKDDVRKVVISLPSLRGVDLLNLRAVLALDEDDILKYSLYRYLMTTKFYHLTNEQYSEILNEFKEYLKTIDKDILTIVNAHPEILELDHMIFTLKKCRGMLLSEDFGLDDFNKMNQMLSVYGDKLKYIIDRVFIYMKNTLIEQNKNKMTSV